MKKNSLKDNKRFGFNRAAVGKPGIILPPRLNFLFVEIFSFIKIFQELCMLIMIMIMIMIMITIMIKIFWPNLTIFKKSTLPISHVVMIFSPKGSEIRRFVHKRFINLILDSIMIWKEKSAAEEIGKVFAISARVGLKNKQFGGLETIGWARKTYAAHFWY